MAPTKLKEQHGCFAVWFRGSGGSQGSRHKEVWARMPWSYNSSYWMWLVCQPRLEIDGLKALLSCRAGWWWCSFQPRFALKLAILQGCSTLPAAADKHASWLLCAIFSQIWVVVPSSGRSGFLCAIILQVWVAIYAIVWQIWNVICHHLADLGCCVPSSCRFGLPCAIWQIWVAMCHHLPHLHPSCCVPSSDRSASWLLLPIISFIIWQIRSDHQLPLIIPLFHPSSMLCHHCYMYIWSLHTQYMFHLPLIQTQHISAVTV